MYGSVVVSVLVLVSSIGIAIAATTAAPSAIKSAKSVSARSAANNSSRKVITLRQNFGNTDELCECVVFHLCDASNVVSVPTADNQDRCSDEYVCCRTDPSSSSSSSPPTDSPLPLTNPSGQPSACICVPFWQCIDYQAGPVEPIENIINPRIPCEPPDFCCSETSINRNATLVTDFTSTETPIAASSSSATFDTPTQTDNTNIRLPTSSESSVVTTVPKVEQECGIKGKTSGTEVDIDSIISIGTKITNEDPSAETEFGEFPWMVALFRTNGYSTNGELICGASLLSPYIVLTAAHCVNNIDMTSLRVRAGEFNIGSDINETLPHQDRTVNAVHIHPNYNPKRLYNDLALLSVNEPFHYDSHINSICAPIKDTPYIAKDAYDLKKTCWTTGWGKSNFNEQHVPHKLKKVEVPLVKHEECEQKLRTTKLGSKFSLDSSFLCAGGQKGYDSCKGDGGGPLFCASRSNENKFIQVGIVSWGVNCGTEVPGVYASLAANSEWITTEINTMSVFRTTN